jgi:hypothetical protein
MSGFQMRLRYLQRCLRQVTKRRTPPVRGSLALLAWLLLSTPVPPCAAEYAYDDVLLLPVRVHILQAKDAPSLHCGLKDDDIRRVIGKVQAIWRPAGVHPYLESIVRETAVNRERFTARKDWDLEILLDVRPPASRADGIIHVYYLCEMEPNGVWLTEAIFVKETAKLTPVEGGSDEPLPRVTSHELGHALGLRHRQDRTNLMASGTTGTTLNREEIVRARAHALLAAGAQTPAELASTADQHARDGDRATARRLYALLAALPGESSVKRRAARLLRSKAPEETSPVTSGTR